MTSHRHWRSRTLFLSKNLDLHSLQSFQLSTFSQTCITFRGIVNYLDYLHMNVFIYMSSYFFGFIAGWIVCIGYRISLIEVRDHVKYIFLFFSLGTGANVLKALHGNIQVLPKSWAPWIIFLNRNAYSSAASLFFIYVYSLRELLCDKNSS